MKVNLIIFFPPIYCNFQKVVHYILISSNISSSSFQQNFDLIGLLSNVSIQVSKICIQKRSGQNYPNSSPWLGQVVWDFTQWGQITFSSLNEVQFKSTSYECNQLFTVVETLCGIQNLRYNFINDLNSLCLSCPVVADKWHPLLDCELGRTKHLQARTTDTRWINP